MLVHCKVTPPAFNQASLIIYCFPFILLGQVVLRPNSANPGLNFNPGFSVPRFKSLLSNNFLFNFIPNPVIKLKKKNSA